MSAIERIEQPKPGWVAWLADARLTPCEKSKAKFAKASFDDGSTVYHGSTSDIKEFGGEGSEAPDRGGLIAFFTSSKEFANDYATKNPGANVTPVYLKIENPFDFRTDWRDADTFYEDTGGVTDDMEANRILMGLGKLREDQDIFSGPGASALSQKDFVKAVKEGSWDAGKYPPAKPGALWCEPLKAVGGVAEAPLEFGGHLKVAFFSARDSSVRASDPLSLGCECRRGSPPRPARPC